MNGVIVFLGGGIGAVLRYWMTGSVYRVLGTTFPYGTLLVNVLGSVLIGFCTHMPRRMLDWRRAGPHNVNGTPYSKEGLS